MALNPDLDRLRAELDDPEARLRIEQLVLRARDEVTGALFGAFTEQTYAPFLPPRELAPDEQARLALAVRNDPVFGRVRQRLLPQRATLADMPGLADELTAALNREQAADYERALRSLAEIYDAATEEGVAFAVNVTDAERAAFARLQLNGHTTEEHVAQLVERIFWNAEGDIIDAFTTHTGFAEAIAEMRTRVHARFTTLRDQSLALLTNLTTQAANVAQRELTEAMADATEREGA